MALGSKYSKQEPVKDITHPHHNTWASSFNIYSKPDKQQAYYIALQNEECTTQNCHPITGWWSTWGWRKLGSKSAHFHISIQLLWQIRCTLATRWRQQECAFRGSRSPCRMQASTRWCGWGFESSWWEAQKVSLECITICFTGCMATSTHLSNRNQGPRAHTDVPRTVRCSKPCKTASLTF